MFKKVIILLSLIFGMIFPVQCQPANKQLIIFHVDLNSVSLDKTYLKHWLQKVSEMGYNAVLWEVENEIQWETCPECVTPDAYTKEEFKELLAYAKTLGLEAIPLFQTIGHAEYVLDHEKYHKFREDPNRYDCYCTTNPEVRTFLKKWVEEYLELFGDINHFHLGGDEAYVFGSCPNCSKFVKDKGANKLYMDHIMDVAQPILQKGIRPGVWSDMLLQYPEQLSSVPKELVFWDWNYWDGDTTPNRVMVWSKGGRFSKDQLSKKELKEIHQILDESGNFNAFYTSNFLKDQGYDVILCSSSRSYGDGVFAGRHTVHVSNIIGAAKKTVEKQLLGTCVTSWAVRIPNYETQEPWLLLAPVTMQNPKDKREELLAKTAHILFGNTGQDFYKACENIGTPYTFAWGNTTGIMWTGLKDSKPTPDGYLAKSIKNWKKTDRWENNKKEIAQAVQNIKDGTQTLNACVTDVKKGLTTLNNWSKAAYFQYWQALIASEIVNREEGKQQFSNEEILGLLRSLREEFKCWALNWMTPLSAEQNSGLIYDSLINYFENLNK